ncbi:hypothetical protein [Alicyclobacillus macrosporangiidus]|uniref:PA14 domain-containing protein n=1 Tax=Alicyclobacillus macrosporangiidus TaxID=392015 RepID=A0A1I7L1Z7_9BACL|nr:hypothetical protein [Alicyclobacillus macrosporangiidus]SFV03731.1 hypothetical protein SAMN05421543_12326 [Alicyclobacillus macrosporangiidus]
MQKRIRLSSTIAAAALAGITTFGFLSQGTAYAYSPYPSSSQLGYGVFVKNQQGDYQIDGGDHVQITSAAGYPALNNQDVNFMKTYAIVDSDSAGEWQLAQADILGQNANNGYLLIGNSAGDSTNVEDWVNRLGGNINYVKRYLQENGLDDIQGYDWVNSNTFHFSSFAAVLTACAAAVVQNDMTPTGQTDAYGNPVYKWLRHIQTTNPPTADSITVTIQGNQGTLTLKSTEDIPWGTYTHHYDAVKVIDNSTGQASWLIGTDADDMQDMSVQSGGNGSQTDTLTFAASSLTAGTYTAYFYVRDGVDRPAATPATTTFTISSNNGGPAVTLTANPTSLPVGTNTQLTATASNVPASDYIQINEVGNHNTLSGSNTYKDGHAGETSLTTMATDKTAETVTYNAQLINKFTGQVDATSPNVQVTWTNNATISIYPKTPTTVTTGQSVNIYYYAYPGSLTFGQFHVVITPNNPHNVTMAWNNPKDKNQSDTYIEVERPANGQSSSVSYTAQLIDDDTGQVLATDSTATITWTSPQPSLTFTASPTNLQSGQATTLSYSVTNMGGGDYVTVQGTGGQNMWSVTKDTNSSDKSTEIETPYNGATTTVQYTCQLHDSTGAVLQTRTATVTWTSTVPHITMTAVPQSNLPGEPATISYQVDQQLPPIDYVDVVGTGGSNAWHASHQTQQKESYVEKEDPAAGQTITVNYTATIYDGATGNPLSTASVSVSWTNPWTGTISLAANPLWLATGDSTTLTATTSQAIPAGFTLNIYDQTTGQLVSQSSSAPENSQYASFNPETDTFIAVVSDGYENVGTPSNTVQVTWSQLALNANPVQLPAGQATTLTVSAANVPNGAYVVLYNATTGQMVGSSQSVPYTVTQTEPTPQTDTYIAYLNTAPNSSGAPIQSNAVSVVWYGITLTANPTRLPINNTSTLTATAQNLPSGYVVDIVDQTTNQVIATAQPGQTTLQALQTKTQPETDQYVARIVKPGNPPIPGLTVPSTPPQALIFGSVGTKLGIYNTSNGTFTQVANPYYSGTSSLAVMNEAENGYIWTNSDTGLAAYSLSTGQWTNYPSPSGQMVPEDYDSTRNSIIAVTGTGPSTVTFYEFNVNTHTWTNLGVPETGTNLYLKNAAYDPYNDAIYAGFTAGGKDNYPPAPLIHYSFGSRKWIADTTAQLKLGYYVFLDPANQQLLLIGWNNGDYYEFYNPATSQFSYVGAYGLAVLGSSGVAYSSVNQTFYVGSDSIYYDSVAISSGSVYAFPGGLNSCISYPIVNPQNGDIITFLNSTLEEYSPSNGTWTVFQNAPSSSSGFRPSVYVPLGSGQAVQYFPYWTFQNMPSYVPTSLFPSQAVASGGGFWTQTGNAPNGTAFFEATFNLPSTQAVTLTIPTAANDGELVYVDGQPVLQNGYAPVVPSGAIQGTSVTITLPAGMHQVIIEGTNTNAFANSNANSASVSLQVTGQNGVLVPNSASAWMTTGYVTQLPSGWFSGGVGTYNFTESLLQENQSQPIYQQQSFSLMTTAQNVSATSSPVSVTWYAYDLELSANPTTLPTGTATQITATSTTGGPVGDVIEIYDLTTNQVVGTSAPNAKTFTAPWTENKPQTDTFIAYFVHPSTGKQDQSSNTVDVQWQQAPLTLTEAEVYHTDHWLENLNDWNAKYPSQQRSLGDFWAGEELRFKVKSNLPIATATVTVVGLQYSPYVPQGAPAILQLHLAYDSSTGYLEANTDPSWSTWFQYLQDGVYTATFWAKSTDNQVATLTAQFAIAGKWTDYWKDAQVY